MTRTSIRRSLAIMSGVVFAVACIGYLITNKFTELPTSYLTILAGIILSYFIKSPLENLNGNNKGNSN